jgi:hypothetical protein
LKGRALPMIAHSSLSIKKCFIGHENNILPLPSTSLRQLIALALLQGG